MRRIIEKHLGSGRESGRESEIARMGGQHAGEEKEEIVDSDGHRRSRKEGPRRPDRLTPRTSPSETTGAPSVLCLRVAFRTRVCVTIVCCVHINTHAHLR